MLGKKSLPLFVTSKIEMGFFINKTKIDNFEALIFLKIKIRRKGKLNSLFF